MASNINPNNIDGTYPVAGQDNDSQGFRTNFTNIRNNFTNAKSEIEDLQGKVILKSALTGTTLNNNMGGSVFQSAEIKDIRETRVDLGTTSGTLELSHTSAHNYTVTTSGNVTISFAGFPAAGKVGRIRFEIEVLDPAHTLTLPASVTKGINGLAGYSSSIISFADTGVYHYEFWTDDGGTTVFIEDKTQNKTNVNIGSVRTPTAAGSVGDKAGDIIFDREFLYVCLNDYDSSTIIWKRVALTDL